MGRRWAATVAVIGGCLLLAACATTTATPPQTVDPNAPPPRTTWALQHRVTESGDLHVAGHHLSDYEESTTVDLGSGAAQAGCSTILYADSRSGPDGKVGERTATTIKGRPGFRSGTGAEFAWVMWQLTDGRWAEVNCDPPDNHAAVDRVVAALQFESAELPLPFSLRVPAGWAIHSAMQDSHLNWATASLVKAGTLNADIAIAYRGSTELPAGRPTTVSGHPAYLNDSLSSPGLCILVQSRFVCVQVDPGDTGPYPDRSADLPTITTIAQGMTFAKNLDDQATWFTAESVFG